MDKYDEINQLQIAYDALKSQPRDAQERMLQWLQDRLTCEYREAMAARDAAKHRSSPGKSAEQP